MDIEPGTVVANRYRISRAIGRGGMGEVFAAENVRTGRPVAVKLLRADSKSKASAVARFRREARAAGSINSDHVTQVLDVEDDPEHGIVIVFELLEGESLIDRLKRTGPIPFEELHPIIEEVWVGLCDAHKVGVIHRDLKPSNVFLERRPDGQQRVKILDFGISKLPKEMGGETLTEMGQSLGTFSFMPPEQIGRAKTVDHRADIYATTTMIYQSLTGQLPYIARNILVMVELKSKTPPRPLSEAMGRPVDQALEQFVATGLARNPADRFQNALDALEQWRKLKNLTVPVSRRAVSAVDLNAQARYAPTPPSPMPAVGKAPTGSFGAKPVTGPPPATPGTARTTSPYSVPGAASGLMPPAPVVPAAMLEPVIPGTLPRLYDQTESTTDISHVEALPTDPPEPPGPPRTGGIAQRGQELRPSAPSEAPPERKGPLGTRVLQPDVVQQAISFAAARAASPPDPRGGQAPTGIGPQSAAPQSAQAPGSANQQGTGSFAAAQGGRNASQPDLRAAAQRAHAPSAPPPSPMVVPGTPTQTPASGIQAIPRTLPSADPRVSVQVMAAPVAPQAPTGIGPAAAQQAPTGIGPAAAPQAQQAPTGIGAQQRPPPPLQLATMRLPDEPSSIPASQDKTTVYRPRGRPEKEPRKKQGFALFVIGAIAFAIVGFGIVYVVQLIVQSMRAH